MELLQRLTSRKFWLAAAAFAGFMAARQYPEALTVVLTFLGIEGAADFATRKNS